MRLELGRFSIREVVLLPAGPPRLEGGILQVGAADLAAAAERASGLRGVQVDLVRPTEPARIIHVLDAVQPRVKVSGPGTVFPGFLGPAVTAGSGRTHVLDGLAVVETGLLGIHEGLIQTGSSGAEWSPFSSLFHLVLTAPRPEGMTDREYDHGLRMAGLQAAAYLAESTRHLEPDCTEVWELGPADPALPRVGYLYFLQSQGDTRDTFLYGMPVRDLIPTLLHPNEILDGAIVSGDYVIASQKNPTYIHQNNPVIAELRARHGRDLCFAGVIVANEHGTMADKVRAAEYAAKLGRLLNLHGVVISKEGGGNAYTDLMLACTAFEESGIRTVLIVNELAGPEGDLPSLPDATRHADAIISVGNNDAVVPLAPVARVVGGEALRGIPGPATAGFACPLGLLYAATNQIGWTRLRAVEW